MSGIRQLPENIEGYYRCLDTRSLRKIRDLSTEMGGEFGLSVERYLVLEGRIVMLACALLKVDPRPGHINYQGSGIESGPKDTKA